MKLLPILFAFFFQASAWADQDGILPLDRVYLIVMENHSFEAIIGNPAAPTINALAKQYNLATDYRATTHPSLPNYLTLIAGDDFGIASDAAPDWGRGDPSRIAPIQARSIADQLTDARISWKTYQEDLPPGNPYGVDASGDAQGGVLYAVKHNPFAYFASFREQGAGHVAPLSALAGDLKRKDAPRFSFIVPNQCRDMHGTGGRCAGAGDAELIAAGDAAIGELVKLISSSQHWRRGRNALVVVWDENDYSAGNHVAAIVVTNYGVTAVQDPTGYSHYSLLKTIEAGFGLPYLAHARDPAVKTLAPLFARKPKSN